MYKFPTAFIRWTILFLLATAGLIAINLIWLVPTLRDIRLSASTLSLEIADRVKSDIDFYLQTALNELNSAAEETAVEPERISIIFDRLLKKRVEFNKVILLDLSGKEIFGVEKNPVADQQQYYFEDYSRQSYFYLAKEGAANFGSISISKNLEPRVSLAVPVKRSNKVENVIVADLNLRGFVDVLRTLKLKSGVVYVVDRDGYQILHPDLNEILKLRNLFSRKITQKVLVDGAVADGLSGDDYYVDEAGEEVFTVGVPVKLARLGVFVERSRDEALASETQAMIFAGVTVVLGLLIFLIIIRGNIRLGKLNEDLTRLNQELNEVAKILVRRDIELTEANARLQELDEIKSEFVSVAAHQLRTPLTGIKWSYHVLLEEGGKLNAEQREIVENGLKSVTRTIQLVNDLLNVARIEEGRFGFNFRPQPLLPIIENISSIFQKNAREKGVELVTFFSDSAIPDLELDEEKISIVLENLLDNAIKYTPPGGKVYLRVSADKYSARVEVKDTGIGIPEHQLHRLFSKFFRANNALLFQTAGSGLGLYVVKNIIDRHGGKIKAESEEGKGTVFTVTLPIKSFSEK